MRSELLIDMRALRRIEPAWWALWKRVPDATPFASPAWLIPWWEVFAPGRLHAVALWSGDALIGFAPLYVEDGPWGLRLLPLGIGVSDMLDLLLDPDAELAEAAALFGEALRGCDAAVWSAEEAPPGAAILALPDPPGWLSTTDDHSPCPAVTLDAAGGLLGAVPAGQRRKWRMARHRADRRGWSVTASDAAGLDDTLHHLFRLHAERWNARGQPGVLDDAAVRCFHLTTAPGLLAAGLLRLDVLRIGGEVAGVYYGLRNGRIAMAYLGGFDPTFAFESPGTLLIGAALEDAEATGAQLFSFLRGREGYKYGWGAVDRLNRRRLFRRAP